MNIRLTSMLIRNFKGISEFRFTPLGKSAKVYGDNGSGKTTVYDAFLWGMFGKDSQGQKDFDVKPFDKDGNPVHNLESTVSITLNVDGVDTEFTKIFLEKYVKGEFAGHETKCWVNEVPVKSTEYAAKVAQIADETLFKTITNADAFLGMKKADMRKKLMGLVNPCVDIITGNPTLEWLFKELELRRLNHEEAVTVAKQRIAAYKKEQDSIPARIDEVRRAIPAYIDWTAIENTIADKTKKLAEAMAKAKINPAFDLEAELDKKTAARNQSHTNLVKATQSLISECQGKINSCMSRQGVLSKEIMAEELVLMHIPTEEETNSNIAASRAKWKELKEEQDNVKSSSMSPDSLICEYCGNELKQEDKAGMLEVFEINKANKLKSLIEQANDQVHLAKKIKTEYDSKLEAKTSIEGLIAQMKAEYEDLQKQVHQFNDLIKSTQETLMFNDMNDPRIKQMDEEIKAIKESIEAISPFDMSDTTADDLLSEIESLKVTLSGRERITECNVRVAELNDRAKELAQLISTEVKLQDACILYSRKLAEALSAEINGRFKYVTFRLFAEQINGSIVDDCTPLIQGIDYFTNASRSERIRAGQDIINALQEESGVFAPCFLDNSESASWLLDMKCQTIQLYVSDSDKSLRIEVTE
jgi:exonuclease SbcC